MFDVVQPFVRRVLFLLAVLCGLGCVPASKALAEPQEDPPTHHEMVRRSIDEVFIPALSEFIDKARDLEAAVLQHCMENRSASIKAAFEAAVIAWAAVAFDRTGPAGKKDRAIRISFWPDPRGAVRRHVYRKLATADPALTTPERLSQQSVALQGLPALELLIYSKSDKVSEEQRAYRCRYASAIGTNVVRQAEEMLQGWKGSKGWRHQMLSAGPNNTVYKSDAEAVAEVLKSYLAAAQIIREQIITKWLEAIEAKKRWAGLPFERSQLSKAYLHEGLRSLTAMYDSLGIQAHARKLAFSNKGDAWIEGWLQNSMITAERNIDRVELPANLGTQTAAVATSLRHLKFYANGLRQLIGRKISKAADIFIGFNELDGD